MKKGAKYAICTAINTILDLIEKYYRDKERENQRRIQEATTLEGGQ